jgi:hypothetical protein
MKALIPISSKKKLGHYEECKMDHPKNYNCRNNQNITAQLRKYAKIQPNNREYDQ